MNNTRNDKHLWWIPLTYTTSKKYDFNDTKPKVWLKSEKNVTIKNINAGPDEWIIFNVQQTGK